MGRTRRWCFRVCTTGDVRLDSQRTPHIRSSSNAATSTVQNLERCHTTTIRNSPRRRTLRRPSCLRNRSNRTRLCSSWSALRYLTSTQTLGPQMLKIFLVTTISPLMHFTSVTTSMS